VAAGLLIFALGGLAGWFFSTLNKSVAITPIRDLNTGYSLINPLLYTETPESFSYPTYSPLQNALTNYVTIAEASKKASYISIYFQDLNSAEWVGVNPMQKFDPASMLKVATLIALLRASEVNPSLLSEAISIPASENIPNSSDEAYFPSAEPVKSGETYTVQDLMDRLIIQSDDGADAVLTDFLGDNALSIVFSDLHIPLPGTSSGVSPQQYSHLFRTLYNATYLTSPDSQKALQLLSQTTYTLGLVAGVPATTTVAHKFGESLFPPISENPTWPQTSNAATDVPGLSDCGIIYYPDHPYFLCVMTQGTDFPALAGVIKNVSSITWAQMNSLYSR
jgi:beta-lactamase class A